VLIFDFFRSLLSKLQTVPPIVWCRQTIVWYQQTIVWAQQTIVWCQQTINS